MGILTEKMALEVVGEFKNELCTVDRDGILAIYLVGSLGGGYYRPGQSDIDTAIILRDDAAITQEEIENIADRYRDKYQVPKGFGAMAIYEKELFPPYSKSEAEEFELSVEIARLKVQGKLIYGNYCLDQVPIPSREHLIQDAVIMERWLQSEFGYPIYNKLSITASINCILSVMRRYLMIEHGIFEFNKFKTIDAYLRNSPSVVDEAVFEFINGYLHGTVVGDAESLEMIQRFGTVISDHYNEQLLGGIFFDS